MMLENPVMLLFWIPAGILWAFRFIGRNRGIRHSSLGSGKLKSGIRTRISFLPDLLNLIAVGLLVWILAEPVKPPDEKEAKRDGIAIELVIDISSSMQEVHMDGVLPARKIESVKKAVTSFVVGDNEIEGRDDDLIGVVTFARYANTVYPLTFNRTPFADMIASIKIAEQKVDGTHFGAGLQTALARLETLNLNEDANIKSRVIVFLTDGDNRISDIDPVEVARKAAELDVRIYTIAYASREQEILNHIAELTGGQSYSASGSSVLEDIYGEIDRLEKSRLGDAKQQEGEPDSFRFLYAVMILGLTALILDQTFFRRFP